MAKSAFTAPLPARDVLYENILTLAGGFVAGGQSWHSDFKKAGCPNVVPLLFHEGVLPAHLNELSN